LRKIIAENEIARSIAIDRRISAVESEPFETRKQETPRRKAVKLGRARERASALARAWFMVVRGERASRNARTV
jgi:hypothetical protein